MLKEDNARGRTESCSPKELEAAPQTVGPNNTGLHDHKEVAEGQPRAASANVKKSVDALFDLEDPEQVASLQRHEAAFGNDYAKVESLEGEKVVLRLYPGGAGRLP